MTVNPVSPSSDVSQSDQFENHNLDKYSIILLDTSTDTSTYTDALRSMQLSIKCITAFENIDECKRHIQSTSSQDQIIFIVNNDSGLQIISEIHDLSQIFAIYIYNIKGPINYQWKHQYHKVKDFYTKFDDLIKRLRVRRSRRREERCDEPILIGIFNSKSKCEQSTIELDGRFVQSQLLMDALLKMKTTETDKNQLIMQCRNIYKDSKTQLKLIDEFEQDYLSEHSLWWYTREAFLYRLLNRALRTQDIDLLFTFGFFIRDLQQELQQRQYPASVCVYRGQLMSMEELDRLIDLKGKLVSVNSFLSTTRSISVANLYLHQCAKTDALQNVLFEIHANPLQNNIKPFADLSGISWFHEEEEILMMLGSVFRLENIYCDEDNLWHIKMNLCSDDECSFLGIFHQMKDQYSLNNKNLTLFASVLIDMAYFNYAEKYLYQLSQQISIKDKDMYKCYHALGKVSFEKGNYEKSLKYFEKSRNLLEQSGTNDSRMAYIYNNIGEVYQKIGELGQAMHSYEMALYIFQKTFTDEDENLAWCYNNLGSIYLELGNLSDASWYLEKALTIKQKLLPKGHPCLSNTYNNLGNLHFCRHEYDKALENYILSHESFKVSLTPRHPSIARALRNIGIAYEARTNFVEAKCHYEKALNILQQVFKPNHPDLIEIRKDIKRVSKHVQ